MRRWSTRARNASAFQSFRSVLQHSITLLRQNQNPASVAERVQLCWPVGDLPHRWRVIPTSLPSALPSPAFFRPKPQLATLRCAGALDTGTRLLRLPSSARGSGVWNPSNGKRGTRMHPRSQGERHETETLSTSLKVLVWSCSGSSCRT